jgi:FKBP-type peptidyl-prolyl cis-trans isomerase FklB
MKKQFILIGTASLLLASCVVSKKKYASLEAENVALKKEIKASKEVDLSDKMTKVSYALGINVAESIKNQGMEEINADAMLNGVKDKFVGEKTKMEMAEAQKTLETYFGEIQSKMIEKQSAEGAAFLKENATKEGVVTLESGLQYKIIKQGTGAIPTAADKVKTHYTGTLINGKKFDSSVDRGEPATFGVTQVIKGWTEALQLMPEGSKWELYIPHTLAYGAQGAGGSIPPYSALIFEIELIEIVK